MKHKISGKSFLMFFIGCSVGFLSGQNIQHTWPRCFFSPVVFHFSVSTAAPTICTSLFFIFLVLTLVWDSNTRFAPILSRGNSNKWRKIRKLFNVVHLTDKTAKHKLLPVFSSSLRKLIAGLPPRRPSTSVPRARGPPHTCARPRRPLPSPPPLGAFFGSQDVCVFQFLVAGQKTLIFFIYWPPKSTYIIANIPVAS